jgi:predicted PurR-regulated permease PerM
MRESGKYIAGGLVLVVTGFLCWYFSTVIAYVLVAVVISFLGRPVDDLLGRVAVRGWRLPRAARAGVTLGCVWAVFVLFFVTVIPLVSGEFKALGSVNVASVVSRLEGPLAALDGWLKGFGFIDPGRDTRALLGESTRALLDMTSIKGLFGSLASTVGGIAIFLFAVTFISFFFLKDSQLFSRALLAALPARYGEGARKALDSIQRLLVRYFVGIFLEVVIVMTLNLIGLSIIGVGFNHAVLIGLVAGVLNVIPYVGPIIGVIFGLCVGVATSLDADFHAGMLPLLAYTGIVMIVTQVIDNVVLQPLIYGNSVHAHPLEIFLVILIAGNVAGIAGMILAIPVYTVSRVILREFFSEYRLVKSLTRGLDGP